jgi:hypothetical protein
MRAQSADVAGATGSSPTPPSQTTSGWRKRTARRRHATGARAVTRSGYPPRSRTRDRPADPPLRRVADGRDEYAAGGEHPRGADHRAHWPQRTASRLAAVAAPADALMPSTGLVRRPRWWCAGRRRCRWGCHRGTRAARLLGRHYDQRGRATHSARIRRARVPASLWSALGVFGCAACCVSGRDYPVIVGVAVCRGRCRVGAGVVLSRVRR